jgi:hypothetical protein
MEIALHQLYKDRSNRTKNRYLIVINVIDNVAVCSVKPSINVALSIKHKITKITKIKLDRLSNNSKFTLIN